MRNANGTIIQFLYGEDGFDGGRIEKQSLDSIGKSNKEIIDTFSFDTKSAKLVLDPITFKKLNKDKAKYDKLNLELMEHILNDRNFYFENFFSGPLSDNVIHYPINFKRLIANTIKSFDQLPQSDLNPIYVIETFETLNSELKISNINFKL